MFIRLRLGAMLLLIAACQSETSTTTNPPAPAAAASERDVCGTITMDELKTAAGLDEAPGQSSKSGGADVCTWTGAAGKTIVVQVFPAASHYDTSRAALESQYKVAAEDVTGIGEKAYVVADPNGATLVVAKGSTPISVQVTGGTGDTATRRGEATAIAHVVLGKV